jgi:trimethylguanosine synthase
MTVGKIAYKDIRAYRNSRKINKGKQPKHIWYDERGEKLTVTKSKTLNKAKRFLQKAEEEENETDFPVTPKELLDGSSSDTSLSSEEDISGGDNSESLCRDETEQTPSTSILTEKEDVFVTDVSDVVRISKPSCGKRKKKLRKTRKVKMPPEVANSDDLRKYWAQRYRLFSRFDEGIKLDRGIISILYELNSGHRWLLSVRETHKLLFVLYFRIISLSVMIAGDRITLF